MITQAKVQKRLQEAVSYSKAELDFPVIGITLRGINHFISECGGMEQLKGMTTEEVCRKYVKPKTIASNKSYCQQMFDMGDSAHFREANIYVAHAWKCSFLDLVESLTKYFDSHGNDADFQVVLWLDVFSISQQDHDVPPPPEWWCDTFTNAIKKFSKVLFVLKTWSAALPLTRAWCLWEMHCAISIGLDFDLVVSRLGTYEFTSVLAKDIDTFNASLVGIDIKKCQSTIKLDKAMIIDAITRTTGLHQFHTNIASTMREWAIKTLEGEIAACEAEEALLKGSLSSKECEEANEKVRDEVAEEVSEEVAEETLGWRVALAALHALQGQGHLEHAEMLYERCLEDRVRTCGPEHLSTLDVLCALGGVYAQRGKMCEAEPMLIKCYDAFLAKCGSSSVQTLTACQRLADVYQQQMDLEKAKLYLSTCVTALRDLYGANDERTILAATQLAVIYTAEGEWSLAEPLLLACLDHQKKLLGPEHVETLTCMHDLGSLYFKQGRFDAAEEILSSCVQWRKLKLKVEHAHTLESMVLLIESRLSTGQHSTALPLLKEMHAVLTKKLGPDHAHTIESEAKLADVLMGLGAAAEAEPLYQHLSDVAVREGGIQHPRALIMTRKLAQAKVALDKLSEAIPLYTSILEATKITDREHQYTDPFAADDMEALGAIYLRLNDPLSAERLYSNCYYVIKENKGATHVDALKISFDLLQIYVKVMRYELGISLCVDAIAKCSRALGYHHELTLNFIRSLGPLYMHVGNYQSAEMAFKRCVDLDNDMFGADDVRTTESRRLMEEAQAMKEKQNTENLPLPSQAKTLRREVGHVLVEKQTAGDPFKDQIQKVVKIQKVARGSMARKTIAPLLKKGAEGKKAPKRRKTATSFNLITLGREDKDNKEDGDAAEEEGCPKLRGLADLTSDTTQSTSLLLPMSVPMPMPIPSPVEGREGAIDLNGGATSSAKPPPSVQSFANEPSKVPSLSPPPSPIGRVSTGNIAGLPVETAAGTTTPPGRKAGGLGSGSKMTVMAMMGDGRGTPPLSTSGAASNGDRPFLLSGKGEGWGNNKITALGFASRNGSGSGNGSGTLNLSTPPLSLSTPPLTSPARSSPTTYTVPTSPMRDDTLGQRLLQQQEEAKTSFCSFSLSQKENVTGEMGQALSSRGDDFIGASFPGEGLGTVVDHLGGCNVMLSPYVVAEVVKIQKVARGTIARKKATKSEKKARAKV